MTGWITFPESEKETALSQEPCPIDKPPVPRDVHMDWSFTRVIGQQPLLAGTSGSPSQARRLPN